MRDDFTSQIRFWLAQPDPRIIPVHEYIEFAHNRVASCVQFAICYSMSNYLLCLNCWGFFYWQKWAKPVPVLDHHDDVIKWKHFLRYWPFVRGIHRSPVNSQHKGQWRGALMFTLICARINGWVNNREAGDLRRHCAHYDVIVMWISDCTHIKVKDLFTHIQTTAEVMAWVSNYIPQETDISYN